MGLLEKFRDINKLVSQENGGLSTLEQICEELVRHLEIGLQLTDLQGCTLKYHFRCQKRNGFLLEESSISFPLLFYGEQLGLLTLFVGEKNIIEEDLALVECAAVLLSMLLKKKILIKNDSKNEVNLPSLEVALAHLSHSEKLALKHILKEMKEKEAKLIMRKLAKKAGVGQTCLVNVLKKLAGARILEVKSLGVKGTYLRIHDDSIMDMMRASV